MRCLSVWDPNGYDGGGQARWDEYPAVPHLMGTEKDTFLGLCACARVTRHMASRLSLKIGQEVQSAPSQNRTKMQKDDGTEGDSLGS